ncbi:hypothetical protein AB4144_64890, partial [Rhizobiaceae sp. 2RAB30]
MAHDVASGVAWLDEAVRGLRSVGLAGARTASVVTVAASDDNGTSWLTAAVDGGGEPHALRQRAAEAISLLQEQGQTACT